MRMPSTQSPWLPLACSLALHSLVLLGGWLLLGNNDRLPTRCGNCVDPDRRLTLTEAQSRMVSYISVVLLPISILIAGISVWMNRRK